ncbi:glmS [Symbiodinium necroappetens]|uniref:Glutamine--fructose-6-phosphate aminotransferase [isomerizing] n=1 Tax=Symbiodinium necroappetens TaxID=1628268 RepID=A0A812KQP9_9DINO|nr:glmS [Symbiodinium necroappetens]
MCGIVAYIGSKPAKPLLLEGLKRMEYRGYDSAGMAVLNGKLDVVKTVGRVAVLEERINKHPGLKGTLGIAHTRWATHGDTTERNAHPHTDDAGTIAIVHNGTIENYAALKKYLQGRGRTFTTDTDTEVIAMLIAELYEEPGDNPETTEMGGPTRGGLEKAVQAAMREIRGAYAIAVICEREPDTLVVARKGSPLIVGIGASEFVVASDPSAIVAHTSQAFALEDEHVCKLTRAGIRTSTLDDVPVSPKVQQLELDLEQIELGSFDTFMMKEIFEQPERLRNTMKGRIKPSDGMVVLGGVAEYARELIRARRTILTGQGTAYHAALVGEYLLEDLAKVPAKTEYASEFRYRNPIIVDGTALIAVSQSGETADTLAALKEAKERGALTLGVVNVVGSSIPRETDAGVYLRVGPEIGVASTKAFTGQVMVLSLLALYMGRRRVMSVEQCREVLEQLQRVPDQIEKILEQNDHIREVTSKYIDQENWLFLGRGYNYPGMPAAEMKHGPIALINDGMPAVFIANQGPQYDKVMLNIEQVKTRGGRIIAVATEGDKEIQNLADDVFYVPDIIDPLSPLLTVIPLQLLACHAAMLRGHDVDKPRNLAKSVTVE